MKMNLAMLFAVAVLLPVISSVVSFAAAIGQRLFHLDSGTVDTNGDGSAFAKRTYFFVGGRYQNVTKPGFGSGTIMTGQMYIESLEPMQIKHKWPIVMIEGGAQIGTNFLNTPDGRPGWANYFLKQGYHVYIVDQVGRGRSAWLPVTDPSQSLGALTTNQCALYFTAPNKFNVWEQAKLYTQWPGSTGLPGDLIFDAFYASQVQFLSNFTYAETVMQLAGLALLEKIGPAILLTHSQSGAFGWGIAEVAQPKGLVKGIITIEPIGPPFYDEIPKFDSAIARSYGIASIPLTYDPPIMAPSELQIVSVPAPPDSNGTLFGCTQQDAAHSGGPRQLTHLKGFPVVLITSQASYHSTYDYCTTRYLRDAGVNVTWFDLGEMDIFGNGHFLFLEKNSEVIAEAVGTWLVANIRSESVGQY